MVKKMNKFTKEIIDQYAENLLFRLTETENTTVLNEFQNVEKNMELINQIPNLNAEKITSHPFPLPDVILREDKSKETLTLEEAFSNCDLVNDREVEVLRVVE